MGDNKEEEKNKTTRRRKGTVTMMRRIIKSKMVRKMTGRSGKTMTSRRKRI